MQSGFLHFTFIILVTLIINTVESYNFRGDRPALRKAQSVMNNKSENSNFEFSRHYSDGSASEENSRSVASQYKRTRRGSMPHHTRRINHMNENASRELPNTRDNLLIAKQAATVEESSERNVKAWNKAPYHSQDFQNLPKKSGFHSIREASYRNNKRTILGSHNNGQNLKQFRPKSSNERLSLVPYRGEFYSNGGKPFSIDPGLIGRWR